MSTWKALNLESDNEEEDEIDDTKEIQIEEALKLYQTALKFHSEGPQSFEKTAEAYKALFESEIFKYPESLSEYKRHELFGDTLVFDSILQDDLEAGPVQAVGANESAPNTLPQILHLSYKNHGQFMLETMQHWVRQHGAVSQQQGSGHILSVLTYFAEALDKEDTDLDLWIRTASVAAMLGSQRITRFCLEAVLDGDDELYDNLFRLPGLEDGFAGQQLQELIARLEDNLSLMQAPLSTMKRKKLSEVLKKRLNPYPFAPLPGEVDRPAALPILCKQPERAILTPTKWDWAGVGEAILRHYMAEQSGLLDRVPPGSGITIQMPLDASSSPVAIQEPESAPMAEEAVASQEETPKAQTEDAVPPIPEPEATPPKDGEDTVMEDQDKTTAKAEDPRSATPLELAPAPSRKRSSDSAGLPETAEGGRARSKRLRAREVTDSSAGGDTAGQEAAKQLEDQLWQYTHADQCLCEVINDIFARLGVEGLGSPKALRDLVTNPSGASATDSIDKAACDMYAALQNTGPKIAPVLLSGEPVDLGGASREAGLNAFLGYAKSSIAQACVKPTLQSEKLTSFARNINDAWLSTKDVAFAWLEVLLSPGSVPVPGHSNEGSKSSYMRYRWTEDLKRHLVQVIVNIDDFIYERMVDRIGGLDTRILKATEQSKEYQLSGFDASQVEIVETLFELHLDIYSLIKHPHSGVDVVTQTVQNDRLERWAALAREAMQLRSSCDANIGLDELTLRHIWASVFQMSVSDDVLPEHVIYAMEELKGIFQSLDGRTIEVQNNAVMPELSVTAVDRELVRISMKDFFLKVFDTDEKDPVAVIESLEPILEPVQESELTVEKEANGHAEENAGSRSPSTVGNTDQTAEFQVSRPSPTQEMRKFLDSASFNLRLSLWQRLREAYEAIEYAPKVLSCYLRSIETLVGEFKTPTYQECSIPERHVKLMSRLRIVDEVVVKILQIIRDEKDAFDCLSYEHMQSSMSAISQLLRIMSATNFLQDLTHIGQLTIPRIEGMPPATFVNMTNRLHDMQLRLWILQYHLLKEGMSQTVEAFPIPSDDAFEYLRHVHHATGVRGFCHLAGRTFLRLAKDEVLRFDDVTEPSNRDIEFSQLLYDLYGLKTFIDPLECQEFGSSPDILDKKTATNLLPFVQSQAEKMSIKELPKHDLKVTIDKVHGALGRPKTTEDISLNRRILTTYFKSPVNPISLFNCLKGVGSLATRHIPAEAALPASKGWYFLMGNIALNKFRSLKKMTQQPTEDLNFAQAFFLQDLEYSIERWETWYRLAQANDTQLEEAVCWNADKMNSNSVELINFQRAAIHCYTMAVACAVRDANASPETRLKVSRMYTDFGNRMYASSREPFSMNAFNIRETEQKYYSGNITQVVYQNVPFSPMSVYTTWKFASVLFKRAIKGDPDKWWNYYMLGKCLWKMYCANADFAIAAIHQGEPVPPNNGPVWEEVIDAVVNAIETLPEKKGRNGEPILEPHYKLVSIVHKLFQRKAIDHEKGEEVLKQTSYAQNLSGPDSADDWERYILAVLKALRSADKSAWHHRIIARAAHVIYDDSNDMMVAHGAKHELTQHIFTKTMAVQVWKPENERPGRHFVYTTRYTKFFIHLLDQTGDKTSLEALAKRVRRKSTDFFEHSKLWQELCLRYLKLLRRMGKIPDGHEDTIFKAINYDEFSVQAARLEAWCQNPLTQHPVLDVLRDVIDLKRLNNTLMKALLIDDLIGDTYALLYTTVGPTLQPLPSEKLQPQQPQAAFLALGQSNTGPSYIPSLMQVQMDGSIDANHNASPFNIYHPSQLQPQQADPVVKPRAKTVGRREIARRAEACAQKPAGAPALATTAIPIRSPPTAMHATLALAARPSPEKAANESNSATEQLQVPNSGTATAAASVTNVESSAPGSMHDDADDESELSELDEEEVQEIGQEVTDAAGHPSVSSRFLFPNLHAGKEKARSDDHQDDGEGDSGAGKDVKTEE
ncbi:hypothetical protein BU26DRAFT_468780 [Trematosphaeria pertusa]|uniref:Histone transcription regulator 3 homolog n=1 Tax=Trematosphaeria pertusa TaxID=390896 RepID=A0A6A6HTY9_9PLEO|nr:uncharacterized protein BU26DRAFT_468780 [Trematosphaeria pertusa]KAF2241576.1 hypothetical protein BU26DRAFT_468780 [Trematosphaeria pertusa]